MDAAKLQALAKSDPRKVSEAFAATLCDYFGYSVAAAHVRTYIEDFFAGEKPVGGPEMFVHEWLRDGMD